MKILTALVVAAALSGCAYQSGYIAPDGAWVAKSVPYAKGTCRSSAPYVMGAPGPVGLAGAVGLAGVAGPDGAAGGARRAGAGRAGRAGGTHRGSGAGGGRGIHGVRGSRRVVLDGERELQVRQLGSPAEVQGQARDVRDVDAEKPASPGEPRRPFERRGRA